MYGELVKELRDSAEWADRLALLMGRAEGDTHAPIMRKAADAIVELISKLNHADAQIQSLVGAAEERRWIPVTERLPYESVFVHDKGGELIVAQYSHKHKWWEDDEGYYCDTNYVTHWMPLPQPPKEE